MRLKLALLALTLSVACLFPRVVLADTLTLVGTTGGSPFGVDVYPYQLSLDGTTPVDMSCLSYNLEVSVGETWNVNAYAINSIPTTGLDGQSKLAFQEDAYLFNQYNTGNVAGVGPVTNSEIQYALWSIMDPAVTGVSGFDSTSQDLVAKAAAIVPTLSNTYFANDVVYLPDLGNTSGWSNGEPQFFMADPKPAVISATPEPSSLMLLGTGIMGLAAVIRRQKPNQLAKSAE